MGPDGLTILVASETPSDELKQSIADANPKFEIEYKTVAYSLNQLKVIKDNVGDSLIDEGIIEGIGIAPQHNSLFIAIYEGDDISQVEKLLEEALKPLAINGPVQVRYAPSAKQE